MSATNPSARRPQVICHMMASLDGRIVPSGWPLSPEDQRQFEEVHASYGADGWLCGRITMEPFAGATRSEAEVALQYEGDTSREDHVAPGDHGSFAFALDPSGRLAWQSGDIDGDHVVAILSARVSDTYLEFLRGRGVSYLLAGESGIDLALALDKVRTLFDVRTLLLEGGGRINGSFLRAGLIDEVSLLLAPVVDGRIGTPALFDVDGENASPRRLVLETVEPRTDSMLWLRYRPEGVPSKAE
jgi:2,5-diamino-6-(ribosylamino)-4(3H)-pyrimidinone 5'-phosphate reductase